MCAFSQDFVRNTTQCYTYEQAILLIATAYTSFSQSNHNTLYDFLQLLQAHFDEPIKASSLCEEINSVIKSRTTWNPQKLPISPHLVFLDTHKYYGHLIHQSLSLKSSSTGNSPSHLKSRLLQFQVLPSCTCTSPPLMNNSNNLCINGVVV